VWFFALALHSWGNCFWFVERLENCEVLLHVVAHMHKVLNFEDLQMMMLKICHVE
jgi:hypothetical protein